jgi:hypothetical protein
MIIARQKLFGNKANKALKNQVIADRFGQTAPYTTGESALQGGRRKLRTEEITRIGKLEPGNPNMFLVGGGSYKGVNGVINGTVDKSKGSRISQLSEANRKKFLDKHNLEYNLETDSYVRKAPKEVNQTVSNPSPSPKSSYKKVNVPANTSLDHGGPKMNNIGSKIGEKTEKSGSGMLKRGLGWASKHKTGLGVAGGAALVGGGGAYLYNRSKKKDEQ